MIVESNDSIRFEKDCKNEFYISVTYPGYLRKFIDMLKQFSSVSD